MQSCVDIITSGMHHYMKAISKFVRKNPPIQEQLINETWLPLLTTHPENFIESCCCPKVPHTSLKCVVGSSGRVPSFTPNGICNNCGINKIHQLDQHDILKTNTTDIKFLELKYVPRQGQKKKWRRKHTVGIITKSVAS